MANVAAELKSSLPASSLDAVKVESESNETYPQFTSKPKTTTEFIQRAKEVAKLLAKDVAEVC